MQYPLRIAFVFALISASAAYGQEVSLPGTRPGDKTPFDVPLGKNARERIATTDVSNILGGSPLDLERKAAELAFEAAGGSRSDDVLALERALQRKVVLGIDASTFLGAQRQNRDLDARFDSMALFYQSTMSPVYANPIRPDALVGRFRGGGLGIAGPPLTPAGLGLRSHIIFYELPRLTLTPDVAPLRIHVFPAAQPGFSD